MNEKQKTPKRARDPVPKRGDFLKAPQKVAEGVAVLIIALEHINLLRSAVGFAG